MEEQLVFSQIQRPSRSGRFAALKENVLTTFFAVDRSPDNHSLIDLQRRACWIGVALILQALNEAFALLYGANILAALIPWIRLVSFLLILGSFVTMWLAFRPSTLKKQARHVTQRVQRWQSAILVMVLLTSVAGTVELGRSIYMSFFSPPVYSNDGASLDTNAAIQLLQGNDPYTDTTIVNIVRRFDIDPRWTTPLRLGQFANRLDYPSSTDLRSALDSDLKSGSAPEFEARVSYPSLAFLTLVPFVLLGSYNVLPFYLFCYVALVALGWKVARKELRPWIILLSLTNVSMWTSVIGGNLDVLAILLLTIAWIGRDRRWLSALMLGLAIASKQPAWFFLPFYAILILRTQGWREMVARMTIAAMVFLAFNLPFMLWDINAWLAGVMAPIGDPMFPLGVGIVGLVGLPFLPTYMSPVVYSLLEYGIFYPLCMLWYWRLCKTRPEAVMLLAVLPLFMAWRSLSSYFYCAALPMFILLSWRGNIGKGSLPRILPILGSPAHEPEHFDESERELALLA